MRSASQPRRKQAINNLRNDQCDVEDGCNRKRPAELLLTVLIRLMSMFAMVCVILDQR
jgi:hypothetical protein